MRRAVLAIVTTVVGLVLLLNFKTHAGTAGTGVVATAPVTPTPTPSSSASKAKTKATTSPKAKATTATTRTVTGNTYDTRYGPVQVKVTLKGSTITDVTALQLPQSNGRDVEIDNYAVPQLRQEAISANSANIDSISGATYTSDGYIQSLQSALDKAGV
jgi:uncharacterized protein with FMN-binding domain